MGFTVSDYWGVGILGCRIIVWTVGVMGCNQSDVSIFCFYPNSIFCFSPNSIFCFSPNSIFCFSPNSIFFKPHFCGIKILTPIFVGCWSFWRLIFLGFISFWPLFSEFYPPPPPPPRWVAPLCYLHHYRSLLSSYVTNQCWRLRIFASSSELRSVLKVTLKDSIVNWFNPRWSLTHARVSRRSVV